MSGMSVFQPQPDIRTLSETADFDPVWGMSGDVRRTGRPDTPPKPLILLMSGCPGCPPPKGGYVLGGHPAIRADPSRENRKSFVSAMHDPFAGMRSNWVCPVRFIRLSSFDSFLQDI